jgi:eukaryotic-like serine/threonine-protein kinase
MTQSAPTLVDHVPPTAFAPGDMLGSRFEILRFLAQGGMGEVYEARDLELGETVALKTLRPEIADDARVLQRFKREITLARKVTHPNVCRIFDVFHHPAPDGIRSITFLAMEMLRGETLAARLRRSGPMSTEEALPLVEQMAAGLRAAHQAGIVHRDLKPGNVILVANGSGPRAVVTDFGLARSTEEPGSSSVSGALGMVGTSAYISPEQVEGRDVTAASDIYSLGVVLYEMVTGVKPFLSDTALATAVMRLKKEPASPRVHRPDLDGRWERAILRCLRISPGERFATVDEVVAVLTGGRPAGRPRATRSRHLLLAALAAVTVAVALASVLARRGGAPSSAVNQAAPRRSVALLGFKNLSGRDESAWLSTALSEMLSAELAAGETLRIIPGENVARMKVELALTDADTLAPDTLSRIRANLGTDLVVLGSYLAQGEKAGERLRLDLRVQDTADGGLVASITETGTEAELLDFVSRGGNRLRQSLGMTEPKSEAVRASLPSSPQVARLYSEGLARLRTFDALAARDLLRRAVTADPTFPLAHAALAEAWSVLGYDAEARREAKAALDLSAGLPREERLAVEGRHYAMSAQWDKAIDTYHLLWRFFPDNVEYGLRLAAAQSRAGKGQDALATVEALGRSTAIADPRIDLAEAMAAASLSQASRRRTAAARAVQRGEAQQAPLLAAEGRLQEAAAFHELAELEAASTAFEDAGRTFAQAGDRRGVAEALLGTGNMYLSHARLADAERLFDQALTINREIGHQKGVARALRNLGAVLSFRGDHAHALVNYEKALAIDRERDDRSAIGHDLYNIAYAFHHLGDLAATSRFQHEALNLARELNEVGQIAGNLQAMGWLNKDQGELPQALRAFEEALAINRRIGRRGSAAQNLFNIGHIRYAMADLEGARKSHEESQGIWREIGMAGPAMENRVRLAAILLEEGRADEAETMVQVPLTHFQVTAPDALEELLARMVLVRCLLAQGKLAEAQASSARVTELARTNQTRAVGLEAAITVAEVAGASGRTATATQALERTMAEARKLGFRGMEFAARLALGEIEIKHGRADAGQARLEALEKEAREKQFLLIARKAAAERLAEPVARASPLISSRETVTYPQASWAADSRACQS